MNSTDISTGRWQVTSAADTLLGSFYFLKVSTSKRSKRRTYAWSSLARQNEEIPEETRAEIDRAIIRYLSSE